MTHGRQHHHDDEMWPTMDPWSVRTIMPAPEAREILLHRTREAFSLEHVNKKAERAELRSGSAEIRAASAEARAESAAAVASMSASLVQELKQEVERLRRELAAVAAAPPKCRTENEVRGMFVTLAAQWRDECAFMSSLDEMFSHPAYREVVSLGMMAVPHILRDLEKTHDYWGRALREITGANPVPKSAAGHMDRVAKAWVSWGKKNGYYW
jgi:hypothetical protein